MGCVGFEGVVCVGNEGAGVRGLELWWTVVRSGIGAVGRMGGPVESYVGGGGGVGRGSGECRGGGVWKGGGSRCSAGAWAVGVRQCLRCRVWGSVGVTGL